MLTAKPEQFLSPLKQAFLALERAEARVEELERANSEPIAIVGIGCRIPGAEDGVESYWNLLREGKSSVGKCVEERFAEVLQQTGAHLPEAARWAALLERVDLFDPQHFGISPREAAGIDPQQRLLLEVVWEALENAGIDPLSTYRSSTGVYVGISTHDYEQLQWSAGEAINPHSVSGLAASVAAGRISYVFGLNGPSLSIDTACSSSLVAVHLACSALRRGECTMALAAGVNMILSPEASIAFARAGMLSARGTCRTFAEGADGYVRGEGCGVVVLKRLRDVEEDGDRILGMILGSAVNQDGASSGLTVPNGQAQQDLLLRALGNAGVEPWQVGYVEAHGSGTALGDPIEAEALGVVFGSGKKRERPLLIGSVKTNLGHLEAAAGVAGLIKVVLGLQHEIVPGQLHFERPSEHVRWSALPLEVVTECRPWEAIEGRRIGGVSSLGFSGTNAHVVLEAWKETAQAQEAGTRRMEGHTDGEVRPAEVLVITARTASALQALAARYAQYLEGSDAGWGEICHTAATGRGVFAERLAVVAANNAEAAEQLRAWLKNEGAAPGVSRGRVRMGDRIRVGLVLGRELEKLDSLIGITAGEERSQAWQKTLQGWGVDPVVVLPAGKDADRELEAAEATVALVLGGAEVGLPGVRIKDGWRELAGAIAELFVRGIAVDWKEWESGRRLRRVALPTYPFQRERYWIAAQKRKREQVGEVTGRKMLGTRLRTAGVCGQYESELGRPGTETAWLAEHVVGGRAILPAGGHLELMLEAGAEVFGLESLTVEDLMLHAPLDLDRVRVVQTIVELETGGRSRVQVYAETERNAWQVVSAGWLRPAEISSSERIDVEAIRERLKEPKDLQCFYARMAEVGNELGEKFRGLEGLWLGKDEALGKVGSAASEEGYSIAPWRLDSCLHLAAAIVEESGGPREMYLLLSAGEFTLYGQPGKVCWSHIRLQRMDAGTLAAEVTICHPDGRLLARFNNLRFRKFTENSVDPASWIYRLKWRPDHLKKSNQESPVASAAPIKRMLLLGTANRVDPVAAHLRHHGASVVWAATAQAGELLSTSLDQDAVLYFASSQDTAEDLLLGDVTEQVGKPLRGLLAVAQAILHLPADNKPRLYVITENATVTVSDSAHIHLLETPLVGITNSIALEAPELLCTLIDGPNVGSDKNLGDTEVGDVSAQIAYEVLGESEELRVAFRSGRRHVARLEPLPASELEATAARAWTTAATRSTPVIAGGVHLITGGLRGIGLKLTEWLVEQGACDLILVGRQPPSAKGLESIARLRAQGAAVRIFRGDIADLATAERVVEAAGRDLRGVWHCAGMLDNALLAEQSWEQVAPVMRPKVDGAWNLHILTKGIKLEFFVLYSSWAALAGSRAQANYCAANAFLDGLASLRMAHGLPALSVNWGAWQETGAAAAQSYQRQLMRAGMNPMKTVDAFTALKLALNTSEPQLAIAAIHWPKYLNHTAGSSTSGSGLSPLYSEVADLSGWKAGSGANESSGRVPRGTRAQTGAAEGPGTLTDLRALPTAARKAALLVVIEELARQTLALDSREEIDPDEPLGELGMDSLLAVELRNSLSGFFAKRFPSSLAFDYPTLKGLAHFMDQDVFSPAPAKKRHATTEDTFVATPLGAEPLAILDEIEQLSDEEVDVFFEKGVRR